MVGQGGLPGPRRRRRRRPARPAEIVWCGARNGRPATSPSAWSPATLWIRVTSSASARVISGRIDGSRRASIVLPVPGGALEQQVVAARPRRSAARAAAPRGRGRRPGRAPAPRGGAPAARRAGSGGGAPPSSDLGRRAQRPTPRRPRSPSTSAASRARSRGHDQPRAARRGGRPRRPPALPASRAARRPATARRTPRRLASASRGIWPLAASTPSASAASKPGPDLAQERRREVGGDPAAAGTRSRSSGSPRGSGRATRAPRRRPSPTIVNAGSPGRMSTSTQTWRGSTPSMANVATRASIAVRSYGRHRVTRG